jgi:serine/threonine protein kinase
MVQRISHYQLLKKLGEGGMAEVFLAEDTRLNRKVALKLLQAQFTPDEERLNRFRQEARAASSLNHPGILTVFDIGEVDSVHFIATEYVEGETLRQRIHRGRLDLIDVLDIATQVASALAVAHQAGIVHRDVKPENIMVRPDGYVKLLDFGIAKLTEQPNPPSDTKSEGASPVHTQPGLILGSPRYMSPEQVRGLEVDARTDIFSVGVVIYEMAAGRPPFEGSTLSDVVAAVLLQEPVELKQRRPASPIELERVLFKALKKDRRERYQTAADMLGDLKRIRQQVESHIEEVLTIPVGSALGDESPTAVATTKTQQLTVGMPLEPAPTVVQSQPAATVSHKTKGLRFFESMILLVILAAAGLAYYFGFGPGARSRQSAREAKMAASLRGKLPSWIELVFSAESSDGGLGTKANDPSQGTQVWSTAQCMKAVLSSDVDLTDHIDQIKSTFRFIEKLRRLEPDPGWNLYGDGNPYTITEIGAWVTLAEIASVDSKTRIWSDAELPDVLGQIDRDLKYVVDRQETSGPEAGGWSPIKDQRPNFTRTYSTAMAVWSLVEARRSATVRGRLDTRDETSARNGIRWLLAHQGDLGWAPNPNRENVGQFDGLTAQVLFVLSRAEDDFPFLKGDGTYLAAQKQFLANKGLGQHALDDNSHLPDADQRFPGTQFQAEGSTFLWFPWSVAELTHLSSGAESSDLRDTSDRIRQRILEQNADHLDQFIAKQYIYVLAEALYCISVSLEDKA